MFLLLIFADFCQNFPIYQIFDTFVLLTFFVIFFYPPLECPLGAHGAETAIGDGFRCLR